MRAREMIKRLDRVAPLPVEEFPLPDPTVLSAEEQDRFRDLLEKGARAAEGNGTITKAELQDLERLWSACPPLPPGDGFCSHPPRPWPDARLCHQALHHGHTQSAGLEYLRYVRDITFWRNASKLLRPLSDFSMCSEGIFPTSRRMKPRTGTPFEPHSRIPFRYNSSLRDRGCHIGPQR